MATWMLTWVIHALTHSELVSINTFMWSDQCVGLGKSSKWMSREAAQSFKRKEVTILDDTKYSQQYSALISLH